MWGQFFRSFHIVFQNYGIHFLAEEQTNKQSVRLEVMEIANRNFQFDLRENAQALAENLIFFSLTFSPEKKQKYEFVTHQRHWV